MKIRTIQLAAVLGLATLAMGQDAQRVQVQAATEAARADLRGQILASPVAPGVSFRNVLERDPAFPVDEIVNSAEQIGGPRWIEQDIVQVRLHLPASRVVDKLNAIPEPKRDPRITPADISRLQKEWSRRNFQATGQAIPVARIASLVGTVQTPAWRDVSQETRVDVASRARASAVGTIVREGVSIRIGPGETVEQSLAQSDARQQLNTWASSLPATSVQLRDDRQVEVGVYVDKAGLSDQLRTLLASQITSQSDKMQELDAGIRALPPIAIGRAGVTAPIAPGTPVTLQSMPRWADDPILVDATCPRQDTPLRTARQAERAARALLHEKINKLKINDDLPLVQASEADPRVASAIDRAIDRARVNRVDYNMDGSATVRLILDPADLIDELSDNEER